jgi:TniQ protein
LEDTYNNWATETPILPPRSRLFHLEPIGLGTMKVESFTGYIARLAAEHHLSIPTLFYREIFGPKTAPNFLDNREALRSSANQLNGMGKPAVTTVQALEPLTLRQEVRYTTLITWKDIFCENRALRRKRRWCPSCYEERRRRGEPVYELLLWSFRAIAACPWHNEPLSQVCPYCFTQLHFLTSFSRPGECSKCNAWLGKSSAVKPVKFEGVNSWGASSSSFTANLIGEVLIHARAFAIPPTKQEFIANLTRYIDQTANGSTTSFSDLVCIPRSTVRSLLAGTTKPCLETFGQICAQLKVSLLDFFSSSNNAGLVKRRQAILRIATPRQKKKVPLSKVRAILLAALQETPAPSMEEVACRIGHCQPTIRYNFPELCCQIIIRRKEDLKSRQPNAKDVRKIFRAALMEQPPPSLPSVLEQLRSQGIDYYGNNYYNLCIAVAQRFQSYQAKPFDENVVRERLQATLFEDPAPPLFEVSKRVETKMDYLRREFPELTQAIKVRHLYYRTAGNKGTTS